MSQSLSNLFIHIIFHVKNSSVKIREEDKSDLYAYMGSIINDNDSNPIKINGEPDHVHILCSMSKNITLAKLVEEIKRHSSRWIKKKGMYYSKFAWQGGYAGFSVSPSVLEKSKKCIENQAKHHRRLSFKEEYLKFLGEYEISFDPKYLWSD